MANETKVAMATACLSVAWMLRMENEINQLRIENEKLKKKLADCVTEAHMVRCVYTVAPVEAQKVVDTYNKILMARFRYLFKKCLKEEACQGIDKLVKQNDDSDSEEEDSVDVELDNV